MMKKNLEIEHDDKLCHRKNCHREHMGKHIGMQSVLYGAEIKDIKGEEMDKLQKREHSNENNLENTKVGCTLHRPQ